MTLRISASYEGFTYRHKILDVRMCIIESSTHGISVYFRNTEIMTHTRAHSPWTHTARVSSRVSNSQCKQSLVGGWHSEGSGGPSLQDQHKRHVFWAEFI